MGEGFPGGQRDPGGKGKLNCPEGKQSSLTAHYLKKAICSMKTKTYCYSARPVARSFLTGLLCCLLTSIQHAQIVVVGGTGTASNATTGFRGHAVAVSGFALGSSLALVNSGALSVSGGAQEASSLGESVAGAFSAGVTHTAVIGQGNVAATEASVANISVTGGGLSSAGDVITADFVMSRATTACSTNGPTVSGQVEVDGLAINGQAVAVSGQANQMVFLSGGGFIIINEQLAAQTAFTVDAQTVGTADT